MRDKNTYARTLAENVRGAYMRDAMVCGELPWLLHTLWNLAAWVTLIFNQSEVCIWPLDRKLHC